MSSPWQRYSVEKFFSQSNWAGKPQTNNPDNVLQEVSWLCQRIEEFFSHTNWKGEIKKQIGSPVFSLTLNVEQFLQLFAWEADAKIAFLPKFEVYPELNSSTNEELKLDDYSNLF